jgi:hypothetical protein
MAKFLFLVPTDSVGREAASICYWLLCCLPISSISSISAISALGCRKGLGTDCGYRGCCSELKVRQQTR